MTLSDTCFECGKKLSSREKLQAMIINGHLTCLTCIEKLSRQPKPTPKIRQFDSGATRDTAEGKLSYVRILSPIALRRYVEYMNFHAKQSDGTMREPDNWKSGFPIETYLDSLGRHLVAVWLLQQGFTETDNHGLVTLEDSLCGIIFNAMGWLHEILKEQQKKSEEKIE